MRIFDFTGLSSYSGDSQLDPLKYISFVVPIKREDVAEWASQEAELTCGLNAPVEPPSWKYGYIIFLKINTLDHFTGQHQLLKSSLDVSLDNLSAESRGRDIFIRKKVLSIETYLVYLKALFEDHIKNASLPSLIFEIDLPSLEQQEDKISTGSGSSEDVPYLLSLPEEETVPLDDDESDSEDGDVLLEDYDSAFFSLYLQ